MTEYKIDHYAIRTWSSRSLSQSSMGMAVSAIYLFDKEDLHRGTISFFPDVLPQLLDPALVTSHPFSGRSATRVSNRLIPPLGAIHPRLPLADGLLRVPSSSDICCWVSPKCFRSSRMDSSSH